LFESHKRQDAPVLKALDEGIYIGMIMTLKRKKSGCLVHNDRSSETSDAPLHADRRIIIIMKLRPEPIIYTLKLRPSKRVVLPHALYIRRLGFVINRTPWNAVTRCARAMKMRITVLRMLKNLVHGELSNTHRRVANNLRVDGPAFNLNLTWSNRVMDHSAMERRRTWKGGPIWTGARPFISRCRCARGRRVGGATSASTTSTNLLSIPQTLRTGTSRVRAIRTAIRHAAKDIREE